MHDMPRSVWYAGIALCLVGLGAGLFAIGTVAHSDTEAGFGMFQIFSCSVFFAFQLKRAIKTGK